MGLDGSEQQWSMCPRMTTSQGITTVARPPLVDSGRGAILSGVTAAPSCENEGNFPVEATQHDFSHDSVIDKHAVKKTF